MPHRPLSKREAEVAELILQGFTTKEIGKELKIALRTVKAHIGRLFILYRVTDGNKRIKLIISLFKERENGPLRGKRT